MKYVTKDDVKNLYKPPEDSHKGQNGRLLLIGGSRLFHAASLWALTVASRIVDLVHYASVEENNEHVAKAKEEFRNGIVIPRKTIEQYIEEDDVVLIGPGMVRKENVRKKNDEVRMMNIDDIEKIDDEGEQTHALTKYLLQKYPHKQWVIDAGALQMIDVADIPRNAILTPHKGEFDRLWEKYIGQEKREERKEKSMTEYNTQDKVKLFAKTYQCIVLLKGPEDIVCCAGECGSDVCVPGECLRIAGGNAGMTKGGTGDVLSGLIAALACKNDPFLATIAGSFINKAAGDELFKTMGPYFNATDLVYEVSRTMKRLLYS